MNGWSGFAMRYQDIEEVGMKVMNLGRVDNSFLNGKIVYIIFLRNLHLYYFE